MLDTVPGGMMIVPLAIGCIINTASVNYGSELRAHAFIFAEANHLQCSALVVSFSDSATRSAS